ncbi:ATP-binding protein [Oleisolibacter albus]|uniref:ATP-binding protein n=1 Tax=Oleisolibacter albus TaxID=2171757 RepID=UPI00139023C6|nr:ATP-binding protein [Oleisolibacter albus]
MGSVDGLQLCGQIPDLHSRPQLAAILADMDPATRLYLVEAGAVDQLTAALRSDATAVVELAADTTAPLEQVAAALRRPLFLLSLTTATAWSLDTAARFCDGLEQRDMVPAQHRGEVELGLHEAVINAVLHGNLGLQGSLLDLPPLFERICTELSRAMGEATLSQRRVELAAWVAEDSLHIRIRDEGNGYDPASLPAVRDPAARSGRGLEIMRAVSAAVTVEEGGRSVTLRFPPWTAA